MSRLNFEYKDNGIILRVLGEDSVSQVLDFYYKNRNTFDKYETDKPSNFYSEEFQITLLKAEIDGFLKGTHARFFMFDERFPNDIIGTVSFFNIRRGDFNHCSIGYKIDEEYRNLGYCQKMLSLAVKIATTDFCIHRIEAYIMPSNEASRHIALKCGFQSEGIARDYVKLRGIFEDHERFVYIPNTQSP